MSGDLLGRDARRALNRNASPRLARGESRFVGRAPELTALAGCVEAAARCEPGVVLLTGEPGIGKSRLLREFAARATAEGSLVLAGRAYDSDGMPPYLPFADALRQYVQSTPGNELGPIIAAAPEIAALLPELLPRPGGRSTGSPIAEAERYVLFQAVSDFFLHAANAVEARALVLCLEDLQWADRSSLLLFQHLARKLADARLCVVATSRAVAVDSGGPLFGILADLARERLYHAIMLRPFSPAETAEFVVALAGDAKVPPGLVESVHARTDGNPFFIEEVVRHLRTADRPIDDPAVLSEGWGISEGVRQVIGGRLAKLASEVRSFLQAAAVLGDDFSQMFPSLARMLDVDVASLATRVEAAVSSGMLREEGEGYRFAHALIRDALLDELPLARRQALHLSAARALEAVHASNLEPRCAVIAAHYRGAGPFADGARTVEYSIRAGEVAARALAYEGAQRHWEAAVALLERQGSPREERLALLERLGELAQVSGFDSYARSIGYFEKALELYEQAGDRQGAAAMHARLALILAAGSAVNDNPAAARHLAAAAPLLEDARAGHASLSYHSARGLIAVWHDTPQAGLESSRIGMELARELEEEDRWVGNAVMHSAHLHKLGRVREGADLNERAWLVADRLNNPFRAYTAAAWMGTRLLSLRDPIAALRWFQLEAGQPRELHAPSRRLSLLANAVDSFALAGDLVAARELVVSSGAPRGSYLALYEGRWAQLESGALRGAETARSKASPYDESLALQWLATARSLLDDQAGAEDALVRGLEIALSAPNLLAQLTFGSALSMALSASGRQEAARPHLERCLDILAQGEDWRGLVGRVALAQATAAGFAGCFDEAEHHLVRALSVFERYSLPWDAVEAMLLRGQFYAHGGRRYRRAATESLEKAIASSTEHGAGQPWLDRIHAIQRRTMSGRLGSAVAYPDGLTEREVEVLGLLASGLSSKQIGAALVLSVRTVERHIANIYTKTATHGRAQATSYALAHRLVGPERAAH